MTPVNLSKSPDGRHILRLNASLFKDADCLRFVLYRVILGLSRPGDWWKADYGSAVHRALQSWYGRYRLAGLPSQQLAVEARQAGMNFYADVFVPEDDWRNTSHLSATLAAYFKHYENDELVARVVDGVPQLERTFERKFYEDAVVIVYLVGTIDMDGFYCDLPVLVDTKTTGYWSHANNPDKFLDSFELSPQLMLYAWETRETTGRADYQCLINGVFLKPKGATFQRSKLFAYSEEKLANNMRWITAKVAEIVAELKKTLFSDQPTFPPNYNRCSGTYGPCQFAPLCTTCTEQRRQELILANYTKAVYDPRKLQEEV